MCISEASSWRDADLCIGDVHNGKEYIVFRIMVQCSPVLGGTGVLEEQWCQQTRVQYSIYS